MSSLVLLNIDTTLKYVVQNDDLRSLHETLLSKTTMSTGNQVVLDYLAIRSKSVGPIWTQPFESRRPHLIAQIESG